MSLMSDRAAKKKAESGAVGFPASTPAKAPAPLAPPAPPAPIPAPMPPAAAALSMPPPADPVAEFAVTAEEFATKDSPIEALDVVVLPPEAQAPKLSPARRARVLADGKVMLGACMHRFRAGNIIDENLYDAHTFGVLLNALKTEPVEN